MRQQLPSHDERRFGSADGVTRAPWPQHSPAVVPALHRSGDADIVDVPRRQGVDGYFNVIACPPSIGKQTSIVGSIFNPFPQAKPALPEWMASQSRAEFTSNLKSLPFHEKVRRVFNSGRLEFFMVHPLIPYWMDSFTVVHCHNPECQGRTIGEIARARDSGFIAETVYNTSLEVVFDIMADDPSATWAVSLDVRENPAALSVFYAAHHGYASYRYLQPAGQP